MVKQKITSTRDWATDQMDDYFNRDTKELMIIKISQCAPIPEGGVMKTKSIEPEKINHPMYRIIYNDPLRDGLLLQIHRSGSCGKSTYFPLSAL
jgi:hypothetical protein